MTIAHNKEGRCIILILSRKIGESIVIGDNIVITLTDIDTRGAGKVRIGITAPKDVPIFRSELLEQRKPPEQPPTTPKPPWED